MINREQLVNIVVQDQLLTDAQLGQQYSPHIIPIIQDHYDEICCNFLTSDMLIANYLRYRFASHAPNQRLNFSPIILGNDQNFMSYVRAIIREYYSHDSFYVNFSPCLLMHDQNNEVTFLYSSNNFYCWDTSHLVHNNISKANFFKKLSRFNLQEYIENQQSILSEQYDGVALQVLSITMYLTRSPQIIFGATTQKQKNSSLNQVKEPEENQLIFDNDCVFTALSLFFKCSNYKVIRIQKKNPKTNKSTAKKLKFIFFKWLKNTKALHKKKAGFLAIYNQYGLTQRGILLIEECFQTKIDIWETYKQPYKRIGYKKIYSIIGRQIKGFLRIRKSQATYKNIINLIQTTPDHRIPNLKHVTAQKFYFKNKDECPRCSHIFYRKSLLKIHLLKCSSSTKERFIPQKQLSKSFNFNTDIPRFFLNQKLEKRDFFFLTSIKKENNKYYSSICCYDNGTTDFIHYENTTITDTCKQILIFCTSLSKSAKELNLKKNLVLLATSNNQSLHTKQIQYAKNEIKKFLSHTLILLTSPTQQRHLPSKALKVLMSIHSIQNEGEKYTFSCKKGKFGSLLLTGPKSGLNFITLTNLFPTIPLTNQHSFQDYCSLIIKLIGDIKVYLGLDLLYGNHNSATSIAKAFMETNINISASFCFLSPPLELKNALDLSCRYGHLQAYKCIIGKDSYFKSYAQLDFSKMYLSVLQDLNSSLFFGQPIILNKVGVLFEKKERYLSSTTFASLLFASLQNFTQGDFQYATISPENRYNHYSMDLLVFLPRPNTQAQREYYTHAFQYHGCFYHACMNDCHLPNISESHTLNCQVCLADKSRPKAPNRPKLWKLPQNHTFESLHPKKKVPYTDINKKSNHNDNIIKDSNHYDSYITIYECDVIKFWNKPIFKFLNFFNFPYEFSSNHYQTLGEVFSGAYNYTFPLLKEKKITMSKILSYLRSNQLRGFLTISGTIGQKGQAVLQDFKVFSSKTNKGKMVNANTIESGLISSEFLRYLLLNKLPGAIPDFTIFSIKNIFLYPNISKNPFLSTCAYLKGLLKTERHNTPLTATIKSVANSFIGYLAYKRNRHGSTHVIKQTEIQSLSQLHNLIATEPLNSQHFISHFKTNIPYYNFSHINFAIIQKARLEFTRFFMMLKTWLDISLTSCNTDGLAICSAIPFKENAHLLPEILQFDTFLKPNLTKADLNQYFEFKSTYFPKVLVCPKHKDLYILSLLNKFQFHPEECCSRFLSYQEFPYKVKIESIGKSGAIFSINRSILIDHSSKKTTYKCSGNQHKEFQEFFETNELNKESLISQYFCSN